jgi:cobalt transporter subunit CbtB
MTTNTLNEVKAESGLMPILFALVLGLGLISVSGILQASTLHDAAHDVRHATGFPCH